MKRFPLILALIGGLLPLSAAERPNFVFFITDDISPDDLGPYGNTFASTPNLDRMAAEGLVFDNAYLTASSCSVSRCSIVTGRYPHNTGAPELHMRLPEDQVTFVEKLAEAGYHTILSGKNHMGDPQDLGFVKTTGGGGPSGSEHWEELLKNRPDDQPFFAWFASHDAHRGWNMNEYSTAYDPDAIEVPPFLYDGPETRADLAEYHGEVSRTDHFAGVIMDELERQGVAENTYFVYCSDNGRPFPRCKTRLYDSGIKTPLLVWRPGRLEPARSDALVSAVDFAATFLDLAGVEQGPTFQGVSFSPVLADPRARVRDYAFAERNWHVYAAHERAVRFDDWLYIRNSMPHKAALSVESDDSTFPAAKELWAKYRQGETLPWQEDVPMVPRPEVELYHVGADVHQLHNLAGRAEFAEIRDELAEVLGVWTKETGDTLPEVPQPDRGSPKKEGVERPGESAGAEHINRPGPIRKP